MEGRVEAVEKRVGLVEDGLIRVETAMASLAETVKRSNIDLSNQVGAIMTRVERVVDRTNDAQRPNWPLYVSVMGTVLTIVSLIVALGWFGVSARIESQSGRVTHLEEIATERGKTVNEYNYSRGVMDERTRWLEMFVVKAVVKP